MPHVIAFPTTSVAALRARRRRVADRLDRPALVAAGEPAARNYPANTHPFRATSHFLYLAREPIASAFVLLDGDRSVLFAPAPDRDDALWHGPRPSLDELCERLGFDEVLPLDALEPRVRRAEREHGRAMATLPPQDASTARRLSAILGRSIVEGTGASLSDEGDATLAEALIAARLLHDEPAVAQLESAAAVSALAHIEGMRATPSARSEAEVCAAIVSVLRRHGMHDAYGPIVTVRGEILHRHEHDGLLAPGDLLLCDVGGESPEGWASDITRTWPTTGRFSASQRAVYEVVLDAQLRAIDAVRPGRRYRDVHETAKRALVEGLVALGIFRGEVDGLLERGAAALFFPHGIGHLLGLDVHDMEDLGDRAGYAPGRSRSARFGDRYLRLDRELVAGMAVTIEPGFYQVPGILDDDALTAPLGGDLRRDVLANFSDVRGIRIEDDVLCTEEGPRVLTAAVPKRPAELEQLMVAPT
jgi:Xaa-Pro aminopeptidase